MAFIFVALPFATIGLPIQSGPAEPGGLSRRLQALRFWASQRNRQPGK